MTTPLRLALALYLGSVSIGAQTALKVEADPENVVASRLVGRWQLDAEATKRLGGHLEVTTMVFRQDDAVVAKIPERLAGKLKETRIYLAGVMIFRDTSHPFVLIQMRGNPHVVYFRERDGDPLGDAESCNVMLARGTAPDTDLLFVGGDHNNQAFSAFARSKAVAAGAKEAPAVAPAMTDMLRLLAAKEYAELIRTYAEPEQLKQMDERGGVDKVAARFASAESNRLQKMIEKAKGQDPVFNDDHTEATFTVEGEKRPLKLKLIEGRWYLAN